MELTVRRKGYVGLRKCIPAFINLFGKGQFILDYNGKEVLRSMKDYDVYLKKHKKWMDLTYASEEGFLDPEELRKW
tara:strand:- start:116 stop:343 length:228 start_codon:yes stop_codon:yes gene_type:complete